MNLIKNKDVLELINFLYAKISPNGIIQADKCLIYKDVGVFFYLQNTEVFFCEGKVDLVQKVDSINSEHYYIKLSDSFSNQLYLITKSGEKKKENFSKHDWVFIRDEDDFTPKLFALEVNHPQQIESIKDFIFEEYMWNVIDKINDRIVLVEKNGIKKYVLNKNVFTWGEIKKSAKEARKMD